MNFIRNRNDRLFLPIHLQETQSFDSKNKREALELDIRFKRKNSQFRKVDLMEKGSLKIDDFKIISHKLLEN